MRNKKAVKERSVGFNVSMPISWVEAIDKDCKAKEIGRSEWIRDAIIEYFPTLKEPEKLRAYING